MYICPAAISPLRSPNLAALTKSANASEYLPAFIRAFALLSSAVAEVVAGLFVWANAGTFDATRKRTIAKTERSMKSPWERIMMRGPVKVNITQDADD
jgi:hypothetical protein